MNANKTMRAAVATAYGGPEVVRVVDVPRPDPGPGQVRIRVEATTVSAGDRRIRALDVPGGLRTLTRLALGWSRPRQPILGTELTGRIDALGPGVSGLRAGDAVVVMRGASLGGHAEYIVVPAAEKLIPRPAGLTVGEAAAFCFGGLAALHYVATAGGVRAGEHVLVNGASGAVGSAALQVARALGAETAAVCSGANVPLVTALGATRVFDHTREDFATSGETYDAIVDCVGNAPYARIRGRLRPGGRLLRVYAHLPGLLAAPFQGRLGGHRVVAGVSTERTEDLLRLAEWAAAGLYRPVIDSTHSLDDIAAAHARADTGRKRGSVVVTLE